MKYIVSLNGKNYEVDVTETDAVLTSVSDIPQTAAPVFAAPAQNAPVQNTAPSSAPVSGMTVRAPMPGNILRVNTSEGAAVKAGDVLFILEAMKMENEIVAPVSGTVKQLLVAKGSVVDTDAVLAVI